MLGKFMASEFFKWPQREEIYIFFGPHSEVPFLGNSKSKEDKIILIAFYADVFLDPL